MALTKGYFNLLPSFGASLVSANRDGVFVLRTKGNVTGVNIGIQELARGNGTRAPCVPLIVRHLGVSSFTRSLSAPGCWYRTLGQSSVRACLSLLWTYVTFRQQEREGHTRGQVGGVSGRRRHPRLPLYMYMYKVYIQVVYIHIHIQAQLVYSVYGVSRLFKLQTSPNLPRVLAPPTSSYTSAHIQN